jgi:3-dehydroquinate dehydratase-2
MARAPKILVVNGPNLNMLGVREPAVYGRDRLADIEKLCRKAGRELALAIDFRQSNHEGEIVGWLQEARASCAGIVINAGAYTHTSIAILDALQLTELPAIEVHLSNIFRREEFRHHSYVSLAARAVICGLGPTGYRLALEALADILGTTKEA